MTLSLPLIVVAAVALLALAGARRPLLASGLPLGAGAALAHFRSAGYAILAISPDHAVAVERLPALTSLKALPVKWHKYEVPPRQWAKLR